jgi:16S rRNA processing protein RimM
VYDLEVGYLGELTDILETGANDVYVVNSEIYGEILIPAIKEVIGEVDLNNSSMQVKLLPGLLEVQLKG